MNINNPNNIWILNQQFNISNNQIPNNNQMNNNVPQGINNNEQNLSKKSFNNMNQVDTINLIYLNEIKKFKEPPLIGLINIGATCYMNATLQCLSNINLLTGFFLFNKKKIFKYSL
jgi:ubiquitin C-terminal hydrolase